MSQELRNLYKKIGCIHVGITLAGIAFNLIILNLMNRCGIPVFLDTAGSIVVAWECGPIFGVTVALLSSIVYGVFFNEFSIYFSVIGIVSVILASYMMKLGFLKKIKTSIYFALILGLASGVCSGLIRLGLGDVDFSIFYSSIFYNLIDKIIVTVLVIIVIKLIPEEIRKQIWKLDLCFDLDKHEYIYESTMGEDTRIRSHRRLLMILTVEAICLAAVIAWAGISIYLRNTYASYSVMADGMSKYTASMVNGDDIELYLEEGADAEGYLETLNELCDLQKYTASIGYIYVYQIREDGAHIIFDTDPDFVNDIDVGAVVGFDEAFLPYKDKLLSGENIDIIESRGEFGWLLTAYEPIYDSDGNCVAYAGADVSMNNVQRYSMNFIFRIVIIAAAFLTFSLTFGFWVSDRHFKMSEWFYARAKEAKDEANRANDSRARFIASVTHEMRTPINTIIGMNEMILREKPDDKDSKYSASIRSYAGNIEKASDLLMGIVGDILDMAKIESGNMDIVEREYNTLDNLQSVIAMINVRSSQKGLLFEQVIDEKTPAVLYGDSVRIRQVLLNLLSNAVKYTDKGGFILKLEANNIGNDTCKMIFTVKDTGIGIKEEDLDKLFQPFLRFDEVKNNMIQGTGLGLSLAKQFAEKMGGTITCSSKYGEGTVFTFTIDQKIVESTPIGEFRSSQITEEALTEPEFVATAGRILVIDDNDMMLELVKGLLSDGKLEVITALSGEEGLEDLEKEDFDLVLLDHLMPGMDGIETLMHIREKNPNLPVIALTGNETGDGGKFYKDKGFTDYLLKPVRMKELVETVHKYL